MLGSIVVSKLLGGDETNGQFSLVELVGPFGSGPGPHTDAWRESFYVLEGELTFRYEEDGAVRTFVAGPGDALTIPSGVGHAFSVTRGPARYLITSTPAGIDAFFAEAGLPVESTELPAQPLPFDHDRLRAALAKYKASSCSFPVETAGGATT